MILVLLPGMDGTGRLFVELLHELPDINCMIIPLPQCGKQDYQTLTEYIKNQLPKEDFILLAESFSGAIAFNLAKDKTNHLCGIIFVASFLSAPSRLLLLCAQLLPLKLLSNLPGAGFMQQNLFFGNQANKKLLDIFKKTINSVPTKIMRQRMQSMRSLVFQKTKIELPTATILPLTDKLLAKNKRHEFQKCFTNITVFKLNGPHFILQTKAKESAKIILNWIK